MSEKLLKELSEIIKGSKQSEKDNIDIELIALTTAIESIKNNEKLNRGDKQ